MNRMRPIAWTIAGSDPGGGAGIQADLKTMNALGVHGCSVLTALTAQNTLGVFRVEPVATDLFQDQIKALADDLPPRVVKLGMLHNAELIRIAVQYLKPLQVPIVCDPLMTSSSGQHLLDDEGVRVLIEHLFPVVSLLTPNLPEAERLLKRKIVTSGDIERAAQDLRGFGPDSVLIKGGHRNQPLSQDYWTAGRQSFWLSSETRMTLNTHGTGCTLSSAVASCLALGYPAPDAAVLGKTYINQGLREARPLGKGRGPLVHGGWPHRAEDLPWLTDGFDPSGRRADFPALDEPHIGLYPVVDRAEWIDRLLPLGIRTIQLRIKDLAGKALEDQIKQAVCTAHRYGAFLFVNDHWQAAIQHDAYGVHLGQDDLDEQALTALFEAGLRLGISTHSATEIARASAWSPSYIAIGTVFQSPSKSFKVEPLGVEGFRRLRALTPGPVVAIGGITHRTAPSLLAAGADGLAVISDLTTAPDLPQRIREWTDVIV